MLPVDTSTDSTDRTVPCRCTTSIVRNPHPNSVSSMIFWHTKSGHKVRAKTFNTKHRQILCVTDNGLNYSRKGNFLLFIDPRILQREWNLVKKSPWLMRSAFLPIRKHAQSDSIFSWGQFSTPPYHPSQNFFQFSSHPSDFDTLCYGTRRRGTKKRTKHKNSAKPFSLASSDNCSRLMR